MTENIKNKIVIGIRCRYCRYVLINDKSEIIEHNADKCTQYFTNVQNWMESFCLGQVSGTVSIIL